MNLSEENADLFYKLMWSLQCYINEKTGIVGDVLSPDDVSELPQEAKIDLREAVYENPKYIADYVRENPNKLDQEELRIVAGWVNFISGSFYIERYLKNRAIFIDDKQVYAVKALYDPFDIIIPKNYLPCYIRTVLLPFKGEIVFDGLMHHNNVYFGGNIKASLRENYMRAKQNDRIIDNWPPRKKNTKKSPTRTKSWSKEIKKLQKVATPLKGGAGQPALNTPAFSLVKNSIELANQATVESADTETLYTTLKSIKRAVTQIENILYRMD